MIIYFYTWLCNNNNKHVLYTQYLEYVTKGHSNACNIVLKLKRLYSLVFSGTTVLNNILLLIARSLLSISQASSSFKRLDTRTFTYTTPTFITEALRLVTLIQLVLTTVTVN